MQLDICGFRKNSNIFWTLWENAEMYLSFRYRENPYCYSGFVSDLNILFIYE